MSYAFNLRNFSMSKIVIALPFISTNFSSLKSLNVLISDSVAVPTMFAMSSREIEILKVLEKNEVTPIGLEDVICDFSKEILFL